MRPMAGLPSVGRRLSRWTRGCDMVVSWEGGTGQQMVTTGHQLKTPFRKVLEVEVGSGHPLPFIRVVPTT